MKRLILFIAMLLMGVLALAQDTFTVSANSEDISQNLDLKIVAKLFAEANTTEQFEIMLNNPDSAFSNLDLNGDGDIDYLRVVEAGTADNKLIVIQAVLAKDIYQDVASIYAEKDTKTQEVKVQIIGDEYVYGQNYIIEPVYVYRPIIYNWFWSAQWYCWHSPYYWGYYPGWWYVHHCYTYHWYWDRCHRFHHHHHHYCSFHHGHHPHHGYQHLHGCVSHREYATHHPEHSFNRRNSGVINAREFNRHTSSTRSTVTREPNHTVTRTYDSRNTVSTRSSNTSTSVNRGSTTHKPTSTQRTTNTTQRSGSSTTTRTTQHTRSTSAQTRQGISVQRTSSTHVRQSGSTTSRTSRSYNGSRSSGSVSTSRSSGSVLRPSGGSSRPSGGNRSSGSVRR